MHLFSPSTHLLLVLLGALSFGIHFSAHATPNTPQTEAIIFGGVDEANSPTNQFQQSFITLSSALVKNGWNVQVLFGNEADCTGCKSQWDIDPIAQSANLSANAIPRASKKELLKKLDKAIATLQSGDELLVAINTHGITAVDAAGADTTQLAVFDESDPRSLKENQMDSSGHEYGSMLVDDQDLLARYEALKSKGVKLAFGSDSCFSGPTAKVLKKYGCVVTQTSGQKYGLGSPVSDSLTDLMNADPRVFSAVAVSSDHRVEMEDLFLDMTTYATNGINSPYYTPPFAGVLEPQFSAFLEAYDSVESLAGAWLMKVPTSEFAISNGQLYIAGSANDFTELKNFVREYIAPFVDSKKDSSYQAIAAYYLNSKSYVLQSAGTDTPSDLVKNVMGITDNLQTAVTNYQSLSKPENTLLSLLKQSNLDLHYTLDQPYADAQSIFESALQSLSGKSLVLTQVSYSSDLNTQWISVPLSVGKPVPQRFFAPTDRWFKAESMTIASVIALEMGKTYPAALTDAFKSSLTATIANAETAAWNSASSTAKANLIQSQSMGDDEAQKAALLHSGSGLLFIQYAIEARMYAYLFHREKVGQSDADVNNCQNFTLRTLE